MGAFGKACCVCFEEILSIISILGGGAVRLRFLAYGDYDTPENVTCISGYDEDAFAVLQATHIFGGGDSPEASKTALNALLDTAANDPCTANAVFLFTDAPPHSDAPGATGSTRSHIQKERALLGDRFDWCNLCRRFSAAAIPVTTFMPAYLAPTLARYYGGLGQLISLQMTTPTAIAEAVVNAFSCMIGHPLEDPSLLHILSSNIDYANIATEKELSLNVGLSEADPQTLCSPSAAQLLGSSLLTLHKRLAADPTYRIHVIERLRPLFTPEHVRCLMTNPMLGKIWRSLTAFRRHDEQVAALCDDLSVAVQKVNSDDLKAWLLSTYNRCVRL